MIQLQSIIKPEQLFLKASLYDVGCSDMEMRAVFSVVSAAPAKLCNLSLSPWSDERLHNFNADVNAINSKGRDSWDKKELQN